MNAEYHKAFYHEGERLYSYPITSEEEDTQLAVMEMLAFQRGCALEDISMFLEECAPKQWDFSRSCMTERIEGRGDEERWRILDVTNGRMYTHSGPLDDFIVKYEAGEA